MPRKDLEARRAYARDYAKKHAEEANQRARDWYYAHRDDPEFKTAHAERNKKWKEENREKWLEWRRFRYHQRMENDPTFREEKKRRASEYRAKKFQPYDGAILEAKRTGCLFCDEVRPIALDFHHIDPSTKKFRIAAKSLVPTLDDLLAEIKKCIVICANCHRALHAGELELPIHITDYRPAVALTIGN